MKIESNKLASVITSIVTGAAANIVLIMSGKGGVLKTTISQNAGAALAKKGKKVVIVDLDPQKTNLYWGVIRKNYITKETEKVTADYNELKKQVAENGKVFNERAAKQVAKRAAKLKEIKNVDVVHMDITNMDWKAIEALRSQCDEIIFDTPGHSEFVGVIKDLIKIANTVLIPFHNTIDDLNVRKDVEQTIKSCGEVKARVFSLIIDMNERQGKKGIAEKLLANVANIMPISPVRLYKRASWLEPKMFGLAVVEASKDKIAIAQFDALADLLINQSAVAEAA